MKEEYSKQLGLHIAFLRKSNGWTQEQLSAKMQVFGCDLTRSALAKVEVGQRHLCPYELFSLKHVFNIPYEELFISL